VASSGVSAPDAMEATIALSALVISAAVSMAGKGNDTGRPLRGGEMPCGLKMQRSNRNRTVPVTAETLV
jgi:hypothetical protein